LFFQRQGGFTLVALMITNAIVGLPAPHRGDNEMYRNGAEL
jgi:hypothetical protein